MSIPTVLLHDGQEVARRVGRIRDDDLQAVLTDATSDAPAHHRHRTATGPGALTEEDTR